MDIPNRGRPRKAGGKGRTMHCVYGLCTSDTRKHLSEEQYFFIRFPKPCLNFRRGLVPVPDKQHARSCVECSKCMRWIECCKRKDGRFHKLEHVTLPRYICSLHFVGEKGPTAENPHPVPATSYSVKYPDSGNRSRKKLRVEIKEEIVEECDTEILGPEVILPETVAVNEVIVENEFLFVEDYSEQITTEQGSVQEEHTAGPILELQRDGSYMISGNQTSPAPLETFVCDIVLSQMPKGWSVSYTGNEVVLHKIQDGVVCLCLKIGQMLNFQLEVESEALNENHPLFEVLPRRIICFTHLLKILCMLDQCTVCEGVIGEELMELVLRKNTIKDCRIVRQNLKMRSYECQQLIYLDERRNSLLCPKCSLLKRRLSATLKRKKIMAGYDVHSIKCNMRYIPKNKIIEKFKMIKLQLKNSNDKLERLKLKLEERDYED